MSKEQKIKSWCFSGGLPTAAEFRQVFVDENDHFISAEGEFWDFKREWPASYSSDYFGGIARLACAFANSQGGVIIFGVDDQTRKGGQNVNEVDLDRFLQAFEQLVGTRLKTDIRIYPDPLAGEVCAVLICPRNKAARPLRFRDGIGKYRSGELWIRKGHEVRAATSKDYPVLFCRIDLSDETKERDGSLPASPSTLKRFVGRIEVLDELFDWLQNSDEPRLYVHGKGGSGKTTIAYEFAKLLKEYGQEILVDGKHNIDAVIFLSAKEKFLSPASGTIEPIEAPDFSDEKSLLRQMLYYGGWTTDERALDSMELSELRKELKAFLDFSSVVMIIDDIDTLTTKDIDPGSDYLYRVLCRAQKSSKVLYTLRNAPSQSLMNSIEVPGLQGEDYTKFVKECALQFKVSEPVTDFRENKLANISERRPLVVESVIAMVRTCGSYQRAVDLFTQHAGENVRDYVFKREWEALSKHKGARLLLAVLADLKRPATFSEIQTLLQTDDSIVHDAISGVREMFLTIDPAGEETLFSLDPLTRSFVNGHKGSLERYANIRERVRTYRATIKTVTPKVASMIARIDRLLRHWNASEDSVNEAWRLVSDASLDASIVEDPLFKCYYGLVCVRMIPPKMSEARAAFVFANEMSVEPPFRTLQAWAEAEKGSGVFDDWVDKIADIVVNGRSYTEKEKVEMISRQAASTYARAMDRKFTDASEAAKLYETALGLHLRAFRLSSDSGDPKASVSEKYAGNTAREWFALVGRNDRPWEFISQLWSLARLSDVYLDPISYCAQLFVSNKTKRSLQAGEKLRLKNSLKGLSHALSSSNLWLDDAERDALVRSVDSASGSLR